MFNWKNHLKLTTFVKNKLLFLLNIQSFTSQANVLKEVASVTNG